MFHHFILLLCCRANRQYHTYKYFELIQKNAYLGIVLSCRYCMYYLFPAKLYFIISREPKTCSPRHEEHDNMTWSTYVAGAPYNMCASTNFSFFVMTSGKHIRFQWQRSMRIMFVCWEYSFRYVGTIKACVVPTYSYVKTTNVYSYTIEMRRDSNGHNFIYSCTKTIDILKSY